jgi:hypothetical protein
MQFAKVRRLSRDSCQRNATGELAERQATDSEEVATSRLRIA